MNWSPRPRSVANTIFAILLVSLFSGSAFAQTQTGNIFGKVMAKDGSALPGVTVTLTGLGAPQTFITDGQGDFRFLNLSPGTYTLKADLAGFGAATRTGVSVNLGSNADVRMTLAPTAAESITVTAEAPLLDVRRTGTGADITKVELEKVPTGRDPWVILQQTPGVLLDRINVGGSESGQQSNYVGKGSQGSQSTWNVDGVNITDVGALGSSPTYYDFDAFEEMQVATGGTDVRIQTPGVQLNMVTKRGTNDLKGSARYYSSTGSLQSDPKIPNEASTYLSKVNELNKVNEYGLEVGGPVVKDRLWLWGAYSKQQIDLFVAQPVGQAARYTDNTDLKTSNGKLNAQLFPSNSLSLAVLAGSKIKIGRNASPTRPPETTWDQGSTYKGPTLWKIEDTQIFSPNLYLTGLFSKVQGGFQLIANNGVTCKDIACGLNTLPAYFDTSGVAHRTFLSYVTNRPQKQYRADGSSFFNTGSVSNELKFGYGYRDAKVRSLSAWPGDQVSFFEGTDLDGNDAEAGDKGAVAGVELLRRADFNYGVKSTDAYVGDTMLFGNLTFQAGLRLDRQKGVLGAGTITANPLVPEVLPSITYNGQGGTLKWNSVSPRLGLTYQLGSDRKTLLRAAANRYVDQMGGSAIYLASPLSYQYLYYYYADLNGDKQAQRSELCGVSINCEARGAGYGNGPQYGAGLDPSRTTFANPVSRWASGMKAPHTDELILGFERELLTNFTVGINGTYRKIKDLLAFRPEKTQGSGNYYTAADYVLGGNATGKLPDGSAYSVPYYKLKPGVAPPIYYVIDNASDYSQTYKGLELNATKRMADRWLFRGNLSLSDWTQSIGSGAIWDPTPLRGSPNGSAPNIGNLSGCSTCNGSNVVQGSGTGSGAKGGVYINSKWAYNVTGVYQVPFIETSLGFNLTGRQGYAVPYVHRISTSEGLKQVLVTSDTTSQRLPNVRELDLRLAKDVRIGPAGVTFSVDAFNILNDNTILQRNTRLATGTRANRTANRIQEIQSPRVYRLGARLTF